MLHTVAPSSRGLLEGVLAQSAGLSASPWWYAHSTTGVLAAALNCTSKGYLSTKRCLLDASDDALVFAQGVQCVTPNQCSALTSWSPTVDGVLLPSSPSTLLAQGKVNPVSVALGANTNDSFL